MKKSLIILLLAVSYVASFACAGEIAVCDDLGEAIQDAEANCQDGDQITFVDVCNNIVADYTVGSLRGVPEH